MNHSLSLRLAGAATLMLILSLLTATGLRAQETASQETATAAASNPCAMQETAKSAEMKSADMDEWMTKMSKELDLSEEQVAQITPILEASHEDSEAILAKYDGEKTDAAKAELTTLHEETMAQLNEVLTDQQMKKFSSMMSAEKKHGEMMEKKGN